MAQRRNMRIVDGGDNGRSTPFSTQDYPSGSGGRLRGSSRVGTSRRRQEVVTVGSMRPGASIPERPGVRPMRLGLIAGAVFLLVCICALVVFVLSSNAHGEEATHDAATAVATAANVAKSELVSEVDRTSAESSSTTRGVKVLPIAGSDDVVTFDLSSPNNQKAYSGDTSAIYSAIDAIHESGSCGFVFFNVDTGHGLAYNADEPMYAASSVKAVLAYYALLNGAADDEYDSYNIENAIVYSDNESYEAFGYSYSDSVYLDWLDEYDITLDDNDYGYYELYPPMSARSLATIWREIYSFISAGSEEANWFANLLGSTETSFIRDGLNGEDVVVMNKAGWIAAEEGYASVTDSSIIRADGHTYIMTIVTNQYDGEEAESNVSALARALFDQRAAL